MRFNVISLFSGCGGSSLGYKLAGGKILMACEIDKNAINTYNANFPETPIFKEDIKNLTYEKINEIIGFSTYRLCWNRPSNTITKTFNSSISMMFHPDLDESLSIEEIKRIFTYPEDFKFIGTFEQKWARIGNSVPPNFMKDIAENLYEKILSKIK